MRLPVASLTAPLRLWLAAALCAAVIGGAYLLGSHGYTWAAARREDGTKGLSAMLYAPVRERGEVTRVLALARDITDQKHTEHQLQQAEKLSAMGQLVSGVAHEINNPAAIISGFAQTLLLDVVKAEHREMLQMIYDEATRIGRITANLLAFARAGGSQRTLVDLNDIVRRTFALRAYHLP